MAAASCTGLARTTGRQLRVIEAQRPRRAAPGAAQLLGSRPAPRRRQAAAAVRAAAQGMSVEAFNQLVSSSPAVLVDFYTTWCGPCKVLDKNMKAIVPAWRERVRFEKIDTEEHPDVAGAFNVHKLPTLILFRDGQPVDRYEGLLSGQDLDMRLRKFMK